MDGGGVCSGGDEDKQAAVASVKDTEGRREKIRADPQLLSVTAICVYSEMDRSYRCPRNPSQDHTTVEHAVSKTKWQQVPRCQL